MARVFDPASDEHLEVGSIPSGLSITPVSMAAWFNSNNITDSQIIMGLALSTVQWHLLFARGDVSGDPVRASTRGGGGAVSASTSTGFSSNTWHHACGVWASSTDRSAFIDGGSKGTDSGSQTPTGLDTTSIARLKDYNSEEFNGSLAEAAIWNVALTDEEVAVLAAGFSPKFVRPENLVFYLPMIRDDDEDIVGGLSLAFNGTPTIGDHTRVYYPASPLIVTAPPVVGGGLIIPVAMQSYRQRHQSVA